MEYIIIGICVVVVAAICVTEYMKRRSSQEAETADNDLEPTMTDGIIENSNATSELSIQMDMLTVEEVPDESRLIEITDSKVLAQVSNLVPSFAQVGNVANNAVQAAQANGKVMYRAIIPAGAKLTKSRAMENAVRGMYRDANGKLGHANLVAVKAQNGTVIAANTAAATMGVASLIVGQYYMKKINAELGVINDGITKISEFQDNEYRSRVFSLLAHVKKIADFQVEILENNELRISKITQLDSLEEECTKLLGQANLTLAAYAKKKDLDYKAYEKELKEAQDWYVYQKSLLDIFYKISDLRYTLHLGGVSREQCMALIPTYTKQVNDTQDRLTAWHQDNVKRLNIDTEEKRRKRKGIDGAVHFIPGMFNGDFKFKKIDKSTVNMITTQASGYEYMYQQDATDLYAEDVQLISKEGKIYYLPQSV